MEERITPTVHSVDVANAGDLQSYIANTANHGIAGDQYVINLTGSSPYQLTQTIDINSAASVEIKGNGQTITPATGDRAFKVESQVEIDDLTISGGRFTATGGNIGGAALWDAGGNVTLSKVNVTNNKVYSSTTDIAQGGGVFVSGAASLTIRNSQFSDNEVLGTTAGGMPVGTAYGGGIFGHGPGSLNISNSDFQDNLDQASNGGAAFGGAICYGGTTFTLANSTVSNNTAQGGSSTTTNGGEGVAGGLFFFGGTATIDGTATIVNSSFIGNKAIGGDATAGGKTGGTGQGGAIYASGYYLNTTTFNLLNSTLGDNIAKGGTATTAPLQGGANGGGLVVGGYALAPEIFNDTIVFNQALSSPGNSYGGGIILRARDPINMVNSLVQGNSVSTPGNGPDAYGPTTYATFSSGSSNNVFSTSAGINGTVPGTVTTSLQVASSTQALNGSTPYYPLLSTATDAINGGTTSVVSAIAAAEGNPPIVTDQTGFVARTTNGEIDVGSVQFQATPITAVTFTNSPSGPLGVIFGSSSTPSFSTTITDQNSSAITSGSIIATIVGSDGTTPVAGAGSVTVNLNGNSTVTIPPVPLPSGLAVGSYNILLQYTNGSIVVPIGHGLEPFNVTTNSTTTTITSVSPPSLSFGTIDRTVSVSATVSSPGNTVNEGTVTFELQDSSGKVLSSTGQLDLSNAAAGTNLTVPGNTPIGTTYKIVAVYSDTNGNFQGSTSAPSSFSITPASISNLTVSTTTPTISFNSADQTVPVSATVTSSGNTVSEGTVTFSLVDTTTGKQVGSSVQAGASGGVTAPVNLTVPGGTSSTDTYEIQATYFDPSGNFAAVTTPATTPLTINAEATVTTVSSTPSAATVSSSPQPLTVTAHIAGSNGSTVNEGTVTFKLMQGITQLASSGPFNVAGSNGTVTQTLTVPLNQATGSYTIEAVYSDTTPGNFVTSTGTTPFNIGNTLATITNVTASPTTLTANTINSVNVSAQILNGANPVTVGDVTFTLSNGVNSYTTTPLPIANSSGTVSGTIGVPDTAPAGTYTLTVSYSDSPSNNFVANTVTGPSVTLNPADTTVTVGVSLVSVPASASGSSVLVSAGLVSTTGTVNEGSVTFYLINSNNVQVGAPLGTFSVTLGGTGAHSVTIPANTPVGSYSIRALYSDSKGVFASNSGQISFNVTTATGSLSINAVNPITANPAGQNVAVSASLSDGSGVPVGGGKVTFTLTDSTGHVVSSATSGTVSGGAASASLSVPGTTGAGSYTLTATYSGGSFTPSPSPTTLVINAAATSVAASVSPASISASNDTSQTLAVSATVTSNGSSVGEGTVTFTLVGSGGQVGVPSSAIGVNPNTGVASTTLSVPAGTTAGSYQVVASYSDAANVFASNKGTAQLAITSGVGTLTLSPVAPITAGTSNQDVSVSAVVLGPTGSGPVNGGTVTFTLTPAAGGTPIASGTATPSGGTASTTLSIPGDTAAGSYILTASYTGGSFTPPNATQTLTINAAASTTTLTSTPSLAFSATNSGSVSVRATVTDASGGDTPNGHLTYTIYNSSGGQVGQSVTVAVTNGATPIGTTLIVPADTPVGNYHVTASYSDDVNHVFAASSSTQALTILNTSATLSLASVTPITASPTSQNVPIAATLKDTSGNPISGGTVTFALTDSHGNAVAGFTPPPPANVSDGTTGAVSLTIPTETRAGTYTITATYTAAGFPYITVPALTTLTVNAAATSIVVNSISPITAGSSDQPTTVTATVTSNGNSLTQGVVTFTLVGGSGQIGSPVTVGVNAANQGVVSAVLTIPGGTAAGSYDVRVSYHDNQGVYADSNNISSSSGVQLLINAAPAPVAPANPLLALYVDAAWLVLNLNGFGPMFHLPSTAELLANIQYNLPYAGNLGFSVLVAGAEAGQVIVSSSSNS